MNSASWAERYDGVAGWPTTLLATPFSFINEIQHVDGVEPPRCPMVYPDLNGSPTDLQVELFSNSYKVFALIWVPRRERFKRKRIIVPAKAS